MTLEAIAMKSDPPSKAAIETELLFFSWLARHFSLTEDAWLQVRAIAKRCCFQQSAQYDVESAYRYLLGRKANPSGSRGE